MSTEVAQTLAIAAPPERVWALLADTGRYAEWVETCLEVTFHHGEAALGGVYKEVGHGLGPFTTRTTWTVAELAPGGPVWYRRDTGSGIPLTNELESIFELVAEEASAGVGTRFTWRNRYRPALGPLGAAIDRLQRPGLHAMMGRSMARLSEIVASETLGGAP